MLGSRALIRSDYRARIIIISYYMLPFPSAIMILLGSNISSHLRLKMWVMGKLVVTPLFFLMAPLGNSCPHPVYTVVDGRETLNLSPSFSTDFALFCLFTTKCNQ